MAQHPRRVFLETDFHGLMQVVNDAIADAVSFGGPQLCVADLDDVVGVGAKVGSADDFALHDDTRSLFLP